MHTTAPQQQQQRQREQDPPQPAARVTDGGAPYQMVADQPTLIQAPRAPQVPQATTAPRTMKLSPQSADWCERCRELAWARGLVGMAQPLGRNQWAELMWRVPSQSQPGTVHTVRMTKHDGALHCDCIAGGYSQPCGHIGAVLFDGDAVEHLLDPREVAADETSAEYRAYFAWRTGITLGRLERPAAAAVVESEGGR